nr:immunoglobulin heavy chain junction region [Mus musculus]MBK4186113.1 immunoglobulin heavy chain junction region [Mus musculus]
CARWDYYDYPDYW